MESSRISSIGITEKLFYLHVPNPLVADEFLKSLVEEKPTMSPEQGGCESEAAEAVATPLC